MGSCHQGRRQRWQAPLQCSYRPRSGWAATRWGSSTTCTDVLFVYCHRSLDAMFLIHWHKCCCSCTSGDDKRVTGRDIRVRARDGGLWRISDLHPAYDLLHFVLFHPHGEPGWQLGMPHVVVAPVRRRAAGGKEEGDAGHVAADAEPA